MKLADIFQTAGIAAKDVAVMFHVSELAALHRALPWLADERPELFEAFQNQHGPMAEAILRKRGFVASFVNGSGADFIFAGLFENAGNRFRAMADFDAEPRRIELQQMFGDKRFEEKGAKAHQVGRLEFDLRPRVEMSELVGRLHVAKPPGRNYVRLAENLDCPVLEITRKRQLVLPPPEWQGFVVEASVLRDLPRDWAARLREWRGVYLIVDQSDGARYVGSAYGTENLLARWLAHVASERGVTKELAQRDPARFRFSILERVGPDLAAKAVIALEQNWKWRLDTTAHGLNKN